MSTLRNTINELAAKLAAGVLEAIRGASLEELLGDSAGGAVRRGPGRPSKATAAAAAPSSAEAAPPAARRRRGRLARRSAGDISKVVDSIVSLLASHAKGLRAEEIRKKLGLDSKELPRPITEALATKRITKQGEKRATTYFAGKGGASAAAPKAKAKAAKSKPKAKAKAKGKSTKAATKRRAPAKKASPTTVTVVSEHANGQNGQSAPATALGPESGSES